jgi:hypothetical protein
MHCVGVFRSGQLVDTSTESEILSAHKVAILAGQLVPFPRSRRTKPAIVIVFAPTPEIAAAADDDK